MDQIFLQISTEVSKEAFWVNQPKWKLNQIRWEVAKKSVYFAVTFHTSRCQSSDWSMQFSIYKVSFQGTVSIKKCDFSRSIQKSSTVFSPNDFDTFCLQSWTTDESMTFTFTVSPTTIYFIATIQICWAMTWNGALWESKGLIFKDYPSLNDQRSNSLKDQKATD